MARAINRHRPSEARPESQAAYGDRKTFEFLASRAAAKGSRPLLPGILGRALFTPRDAHLDRLAQVLKDHVKSPEVRACIDENLALTKKAVPPEYNAASLAAWFCWGRPRDR